MRQRDIDIPTEDNILFWAKISWFLIRLVRVWNRGNIPIIAELEWEFFCGYHALLVVADYCDIYNIIFGTVVEGVLCFVFSIIYKSDLSVQKMINLHLIRWQFNALNVTIGFHLIKMYHTIVYVISKT